MIFFEASKKNYLVMQEKIGNKTKKSFLRKIFGLNKEVILVNKAVGAENKKIFLNIETANDGLSNSILAPGLHLEQYPNIQFNQKEEVEMVTLDSEIIEKSHYNFLVMDVHGYELEVLKGSKEILKNISLILTEVNRDEVYEGCAKIEELDKFLNDYKFKRIETDFYGGAWGDALYIKS